MLKKEYKFLIIFVGIVGLFFYQFFLFGKIPFPGDLLLSYNPWHTYSFFGFAPGGFPHKAQYFDVLRQLFPWKVLVIESFKQFSIPLWNPYNFSGTPLLANNQSAAFYPLNFLYFLLPQSFAWGILVMMQPLLAGIGTYLFMRKIGVGKWGSLFSGIAYGFCLFQAVFLEYNTMGHVIALLPWTLFGIELLLQGKRVGYSIFIFSLVFSFFAGHIQLWGFSFLFILIYSAFRSMLLKQKVRFALELTILAILTIAMTGMQLLPTFELIQHAARVSQNYSFLIHNLLIQPFQLIVLLIPDVFGNPATRNYLLTDSYPGNAMYIGVLPLLFGFVSLTKIKTNKMLLFFGASFVALLFFLVRSPLTEIFYRLQIPLFSTGSPSNALFLVSFSLAVMAGFGLEYTLQGKNKTALFMALSLFGIVGLTLFLSKLLHFEISQKNAFFSLLLVGIGGILTGANAFFKKGKTIIVVGIILFTVFDLFYFFQKFNPFVKPALIYPPTGVLTKLQQEVGNQRVWSYGEAEVDSNVLSVFHLEDPTGYDPLYPKVYGEFISSSTDGKIHTVFTNQSRSDAVIAQAFKEDDLAKNPYRFTVLNATSVSYILSKEVLSTDFLKTHHWEFSSSVDNWNIYRNLSALPHAYLVNAYTTYTNGDDFSKKFYADSFDMQKVVLLEKNIGSLGGRTGNVVLQTYTPENILLQTKTDGNNLLVLTDTYYPGWKAFVDGKETPILKANFTFRAIKIPTGEHRVQFVYQPASFSQGLTLTIIGLVGFIVFLSVTKRSKIYE